MPLECTLPVCCWDLMCSLIMQIWRGGVSTFSQAAAGLGSGAPSTGCQAPVTSPSSSLSATACGGAVGGVLSSCSTTLRHDECHAALDTRLRTLLSTVRSNRQGEYQLERQRSCTDRQTAQACSSPSLPIQPAHTAKSTGGARVPVEVDQPLPVPSIPSFFRHSKSSTPEKGNLVVSATPHLSAAVVDKWPCTRHVVVGLSGLVLVSGLLVAACALSGQRSQP